CAREGGNYEDDYGLYYTILLVYW
nr:immunoglobulin heavy chain junction region [Macaca mulatta]MOX94816.1 immunoglobulin heavy chain junction region [Macaca mulatta]MOX95935.1 immunoglobulin heavy chain junction region [Macaca mulatta]MOX96141.1 immunoglobulin heavy chain junction region [Macaca mulatta]MOX96913.1 immunoglobulin heavy chain junction region [Macaca mulatta]